MVRNQLGPRYEVQLILMAEPIPYPKRPPRTPSRRPSYFAADGRAGIDSPCLIVSIGHASYTWPNKRVGLAFDEKHAVFRVTIKVTEKLVVIR